MTYKILAELPNVNYLSTSSYHRYLNTVLPKILGLRINSFSIFEKGTVRIYMHDEEWKQVNEKLFRIFLEKPNELIEYHKTIRKTGIAYIEFAKKFRKKNFARMSNKELVNAFKEFYREHTKNHHLGLLDALLELYDENISRHIRQLMENKNPEKKGIDAAEALSVLTTPLEHSTINKEKLDLIRIALEQIKFENSGNKQTPMNSLLAEHHKKYCWMGHMYIGPELAFDYYKERLKAYLENRNKIIEDLKKILNKNEVMQNHKKIIKALRLGEKAKKQIRIAQEILFLKLLRKDSMIHGWYSADGLIKQISNRLKISTHLTCHLMPYEIEDALLRSKIPNLSERYRLSVIDFQEGKEKIITGDESWEIEKNRTVSKTLNLEELKGTCAYSGKAKGTVKIVNSRSDIKKVKKGDIIVSYQTNPELIVAMEKASAIITDKGGLTCHASIVARELKIPCIVGTEHASKLLKDEDIIEVDSANVEVNLISKSKTVLKGTCAYKGKAKGSARIVNIPEDIRNFEKGNILVSFSTNQDLVPAMEKAAAIVTDRGGVTCHAAIVARELQIPCLVGTEIATKVIKNDDIVEVDTYKETAIILDHN